MQDHEYTQKVDDLKRQNVHVKSRWRNLGNPMLGIIFASVGYVRGFMKFDTSYNNIMRCVAICFAVLTGLAMWGFIEAKLVYSIVCTG